MVRVVRVAINALALLAASLLVPGIDLELTDEASGAVVVLATIAIVFGLVNALVRPVARLVSIPLRVLTLGLFSLVLNAGLLLLVAAVVDVLGLDIISIGGFPPDLGIDAVVSALAGGLIISVISTSMNLLIRDP
jgi:putative membrane protein